MVDTPGLLIATVVVAANMSDNAGGCDCIDRAAPASRPLIEVWSDVGFEARSTYHCRHYRINAELVSRTNAHALEELPRRWVLERT